MIPQSLQTLRLHLRAPRLEDAELILHRWAHDPAVTRYMSWKPHQTVDQSLQFIRQALQDAHADKHTWLIEQCDDTRLLGSVGLRRDGHRVELGYCLARDAWGQGYATEAARAVTEAALADPAIYRVSACCAPANHASVRVMEKIGMRREGLLRAWLVLPNISDRPQDMLCYAKAKP